MKVCVKAKVIVLLAFLSLFSGCASTQLHGWVWTPEKVHATNLKILVKAEPGNKSAWVKADGSFVLKGLEPRTAYNIMAICEEDNTRARVDNILINKGKNELPENKMLILATHIPAPPSSDTTKFQEPGPGRQVPDKP